MESSQNSFAFGFLFRRPQPLHSNSLLLSPFFRRRRGPNKHFPRARLAHETDGLFGTARTGPQLCTDCATGQERERSISVRARSAALAKARPRTVARAERGKEAYFAARRTNLPLSILGERIFQWPVLRLRRRRRRRKFDF